MDLKGGNSGRKLNQGLAQVVVMRKNTTDGVHVTDHLWNKAWRGGPVSTEAIKRWGQRSPCKLGYTRTYIKVTNFLIFHLRTRRCNGSLWPKSVTEPYIMLLSMHSCSQSVSLLKVTQEAANTQKVRLSLTREPMQLEKPLSRGQSWDNAVESQ